MAKAQTAKLTPLEEAAAAYKERKAHPPKHIDNASLYAGSPMYFYCRHCGHDSDCLPESYIGTPRRICGACQAYKELGGTLD